MKKIFSFLLTFVVCMTANAASDNGYQILGKVTNIPDGTMLYLQLVGPPNQKIDSTAIHDGAFVFKGAAVKAPVWSLITIKGQFVAVCDFYLENGNITISGDRYGAVARGSETNEQYLIYNTDVNRMFNDAYGLNLAVSAAKGKAAADSAKAALQACQQELLSKEIAFVKKYPSSPISLRIVDYICRNAKSDDIIRYISYLSPEMQKTDTMTKLKERSAHQRLTEDGTIAPAFTLLSKEKKSVSLADYKGKYVLLDFWASWCAPCRASFPDVASIYAKYKTKNFTVLGISLDRKEGAWLKALNEEKCTWTQVVDLKGDVAYKYSVVTIPFMVLVGPDGKIIGKFDKSQIVDKLETLFDNK